MKWEFAPHSKCKNYKLVATDNYDKEITIHIAGVKEGEILCKLHEVHNYSEEMQEYVRDLLPKIVSGVYDIKLTEGK